MLRADSQVSGITISGNHISLNGPSRSACGIYILDVNNAVISGNTIAGGSQAIGIKGYTHSVTGAQIYGNIISGKKKDGMFTGRRSKTIAARTAFIFTFC
ncbi:MAG: right-handed parallel beta-helix repeat-containing protein [Bryobacteraceae bacterium]